MAGGRVGGAWRSGGRGEVGSDPAPRWHRHEFDSERVPALARAPFLQDVHSVSSLCKLYFRELPAPLLTHRLHPRFAVSPPPPLPPPREALCGLPPLLWLHPLLGHAPGIHPGPGLSFWERLHLLWPMPCLEHPPSLLPFGHASFAGPAPPLLGCASPVVPPPETSLPWICCSGTWIPCSGHASFLAMPLL